MNLKLTLEYDGSGYSGWQDNAGVISIQGELTKAYNTFVNSLYKKNGIEESSNAYLKASGRTDAGVSAKAQVVNVTWDERIPLDSPSLAKGLSALSAPGIFVRNIEIVPPDFDARFSAKSKCYTYLVADRASLGVLTQKIAWQIDYAIDLSAIIFAAKLFVGKHDFSGFRASDCNARTTTRTIELLEVTRLPNSLIEFRIVGDGFLKQMVRIIVGTLIAVGKGKFTAQECSDFLQGVPRTSTGETAPAHGLTLEWVRY